MRRQEHETALRFFNRATQVEPTFTYAYTLAGHEYLANEDFQRGLEAYRTALRLDPRHYNAWCAADCGGRPGLLCCISRQAASGSSQFHRWLLSMARSWEGAMSMQCIGHNTKQVKTGHSYESGEKIFCRRLERTHILQCLRRPAHVLRVNRPTMTGACPMQVRAGADLLPAGALGGGRVPLPARAEHQQPLVGTALLPRHGAAQAGPPPGSVGPPPGAHAALTAHRASSTKAHLYDQ